MFSITQGDDFSYTFALKPRGNGASSFTGYTITGAILLPNGQRKALTFTSVDDTSFTLSAAPAATSNWPIGPAKFNALFVHSGITRSSPPISINIVSKIA